MNKFFSAVINTCDKAKGTHFSRSIRDGMVMASPIILFGSFTVMLLNIPFEPYQYFIKECLGGFFFKLFEFLHFATFGMLSVYATFTISIAVVKNFLYEDIKVGAIFSALVSFFIFTRSVHADNSTFFLASLGAEGMISAIIAGYCCTSLYLVLEKRLETKTLFISEGSDLIFSEAIHSFFPFCITALVSVFFNLIFVFAFKTSCFNNAISSFLCLIFSNLGTTFSSQFLYLFLVHFFWFFGIHGNNILENVSSPMFYFDPESSNIYSKAFSDVFSLMGGSGATWCLIVAIFIFTKKRSDKKLEYLAFLPSVFNINELMIYGLPIIFNPIYFIPFIFTPLVSYCVAFLSYKIGFLTEFHQVSWTTPIFISGYFATNSWRGVLIQVINFLLGILIYAPFVKLGERYKNVTMKSRLDDLVERLKESERSTLPISLLGGSFGSSIFANSLAKELESALKKQELKLYYQPQYNADGKCIGSESLLRWKHPLCGEIYPPLMFQLAKEAGFLYELETYVFNIAFQDYPKICAAFGSDYRISVNVTSTTIQNERFQNFLEDKLNTYHPNDGQICIEITEQASLPMDEEFISKLSVLKRRGYSFAIDDFSMGHTSIAYLKTNIFDEVKLDGSLVHDMMDNDRCKEIINSISFLAHSLDFTILAEYVETDEQREMLAKLGCYEYQGFLYSAPVSLERLLENK